ncbi:MAG: TauD/TfdA family dioxygenase [Gammaproteobacteria bacterium]|nr:TauD/TfdA family dioxygenase [Gammaproteobacteria bacterium]
MISEPIPLNGEFGVLLESVTPDDLRDEDFQRRAYALWLHHRGLLVVRGESLVGLRAEALVDWAGVFGEVDPYRLSGREAVMVEGFPILRIGNVQDADGRRRASFTNVPQLRSDADVRYDPRTRRPVWHTDATFKPEPPIGSVFHCKQAPPQGGDTLFADTRGAYAALDEATRQKLMQLEAVCSLAHHDKKISLYSPGYPTLSPEQRAANPPNRVPVVLTHPLTGQPALYGLNSSTCALVRKGEPIEASKLDEYDLQGVEDDSVGILRELLPMVTGPEFTVRWRWQPGDIVVWDNRCTMHAATGFDHENHLREMWRLTLLQARAGAAARA